MRTLASTTRNTEKVPAHRFSRDHNRGVPERDNTSPVPFFSEHMIQRKASCACGGGCPNCQSRLPIQAKLKIGAPDDKYEQEADRVAEQVMTMPEPKVQRQIEDGQEEEPAQAKSLLQRQAEDEEEVLQGSFISSETSAQFQSDVGEAENRNGMPRQLKAGLEALSGMDLSDIRVHNNSSKPAQLNALAYTQGQDIHVGPGQEKHLPHEGWHAVQQMQGRVKPTMQAKGASMNDDKELEREADVMGAKALQMKGVSVKPRRGHYRRSTSLQRPTDTKGESEAPGEAIGISGQKERLPSQSRRVDATNLPANEYACVQAQNKKGEADDYDRQREVLLNHIRRIAQVETYRKTKAAAIQVLINRLSISVKHRLKKDEVFKKEVRRLISRYLFGDILKMIEGIDIAAELEGEEKEEEDFPPRFWAAHYVDNNIEEAIFIGDDDTNMLNISHDKYHWMLIRYRDRRELKLDINRIPVEAKRWTVEHPIAGHLELLPTVVAIGKPRRRKPPKYELHGGFIYPTYGGEISFNIRDTYKIVMLRSDFHRRVTAATDIATLMQAIGAFSGAVGALGGLLNVRFNFTHVRIQANKPKGSGGGGPTKKGRPSIDPEIDADVDRAFSNLGGGDSSKGGKGRAAGGDVSSGTMVRVPVNKEGKPVKVLEVGAGPKKVNLALPPERTLVVVKSTDKTPTRSDVSYLDAQVAIPKKMHGTFTTIIINNPYGYRANIGQLKKGLSPGGKIIIQGNWKSNKYFRGLQKVKVTGLDGPKIERNVPPLGEGFSYTDPGRLGAPVPDSRITFERPSK